MKAHAAYRAEQAALEAAKSKLRIGSPDTEPSRWLKHSEIAD